MAVVFGVGGHGVSDEVDSEQTIHTVEIRGLAAGGAGVGSLPDGRTVFVDRAAPGDRGAVEIRQSKSRWARGVLVELHNSGTSRRPARCPLYDRCGGCALQHVDYGEQVAWKGKMVDEALRRIGRFTPPPVTVTPSPIEWRYRNRVTFHLRRLPSGRIVAGFHERGRPGRVVDMVDQCLLPEQELLDVWSRLRLEWGLKANLLPPGPALRITLTVAQNGSAMIVEPEAIGARRTGRRTTKVRQLSKAELAASAASAEQLCDRVEGLTEIWWRTGTDGRPHLLASSRPVFPGETLSFRQVHGELTAALRRAVLDPLFRWGVAGKKIIDGYAGVGAYARALASEGAESIAVESNRWAVESAAQEPLDGLTMIQGDVAEELPRLLPADGLILNPPRSGLAPSIPGAILERPPEMIVYASCDPATLARDVKALMDRYVVVSACAFDLFPQTPHVESVLVLRYDSGKARS